MMRRLAPLALRLAALPCAAACTGDDVEYAPAHDAGYERREPADAAATDGAHDIDAGAMDAARDMDAAAIDVEAPDAAVPDAGRNVNGCIDAIYLPGDTIQWGFIITPKCLVVPKGTKVTWKGDFVAHPLDATGGDPGSPIQTTTTGTEVSFVFDTPGVYGYDCDLHPFLLGAVKVTP